ncbi:MAG: zinc-dependent alcohol dehydrogenase family protein [Steroidobacteraceae bacterium]|nr:zinc-dependent alcohol dehydrogenase family protein [Steroidobacteraceae bacterium]
MPIRLRHDRFGEPAEVLRLEEFDPPQPGPGQVVLRMEAAAMHIADIRSVQSGQLFGHALPRTPGFEGIGRVLRVGPGVEGVSVGDRLLPPSGSGTFTEEHCVPAADCLPAPEGDALQLALATINGTTAWVMVDDFAAFEPGSWILQNAANSNCGRYLIALAKERGLRTVNLLRRPELGADLAELGADVVLVDGEGLAARVLAATNGVAPRVAFDAVGGAATQRLAECVAPGGKVVSYGEMSGEPCRLSFYTMFMRDVGLVGLNFKRQVQRRSLAEQRAVGVELALRIGDGRLRARIAASYGLVQWREAFAQAARTGGDRDGKVVFDLR